MSTAATASFSYCAYGYRPPGTPSLGFSGELADACSGTYPLGNGHRLYSPILMRFYSPDNLSPFGRGGLNPYAYCEADPINWTDPTAKHRTIAARALGVAAGGGVVATIKAGAEFIAGVWTTSKRALTRGPVTPEHFPTNRYTLREAANPANRPFNNAVRGVNENLGSHGDGALSAIQAQYYIAGTWSEDSNTTLHLHSTLGWGVQLAQTADPAAATGALFNGIATLVSGALDAREYKTGRAYGTPTLRNQIIRQ